MTQSLQVADQPRFTSEQIKLLKDTVCKGATDDEFKIFCYAVQRTGLDPFMKQIHAVRRDSQMTILVGIDGLRLIADRTAVYAGNDEPIFDNEKNPNKATVTVYKLVNGIRCPFTASARWDEYYPGEKQGFMWKKMPCVMLGKVAEGLALRKAFPADLSGLYTTEEMEQSGSVIEVKKETKEEIEKKQGGSQIAQLRNELGITPDEIKSLCARSGIPQEFVKMELQQVYHLIEILKDEKRLRAGEKVSEILEEEVLEFK